METHLEIGTPGSRLHFSEPRVHAMVYEPTTGEMRKLPVNFNDYLKELRQVYDLYSVEPNSSQDGTTKDSSSKSADNSGSSTAYPVEDDLQDEEEVALQDLIDHYPAISQPHKPPAN